MLNYLWAGLILLSLGFAVASDAFNLATNPYGNGRPLTVAVETDGADSRFIVTPEAFEARFGRPPDPAEPIEIPFERVGEGDTVRLIGNLVGPLGEMAIHEDPEKEALTATYVEEASELRFAPVRFMKLVAVQRGAFDMAGTAVTIAIGLIGLLALWLGLVKIGEAAGMIHSLVGLVRPLLGWLFPQIPKDHPALGLIALNLTANVLGLGNAATPLGLKAMQSLQDLNPSEDTATNPMVMLLALNTASVQLVPPVTLVAIMGLEAGRLWLPIVVVTGLSLVVAILAAKILGRMPMFRRTDPDLVSPAPAETEVA